MQGDLRFFCLQALAPSMDWLEFLSFLLSPLELSDSEPVVVYGMDYLQQVSELINRTEPRSGGAQDVDGGAQGSVWVPSRDQAWGTGTARHRAAFDKTLDLPNTKPNVCGLFP